MTDVDEYAGLPILEIYPYYVLRRSPREVPFGDLPLGSTLAQHRIDAPKLEAA